MQHSNLSNGFLRFIYRKIQSRLAFVVCLCLIGLNLGTLPLKAQNTTVSIDARNLTVEEVLNQIKTKTGYDFFFNNKHVDLKRKVTLSQVDGTLSEILGKLFDGTDTAYSVLDNQIILSKKTTQNQHQQNNYKITGMVLDSNKNPIIGASIRESGTSNGTITDLDGNFSLILSQSNKVEISFVGFITQTLATRPHLSHYLIELKEDNQMLDEVVVVGYGSQKKVNVIGSIAAVDGKALQNRTSTNVGNMLSGQLSGVTITQSSGNPGDDAGTIRVRGVGSFGATPTPLVLVDGMPGDLSQINPSDIDNISVLKDASSAAIYGSRAANGVILVTTKKGKEGRVHFTYNGSVGSSQATSLPEYAHSYEFATFYNIATNTKTYSDEMIRKFKDGSEPINYPDEMYLKQLLGGHALQTKHEISVTAGTDKVQFMTSAGYLRQNGLLKNNFYNRYNARVNMSSALTKNLHLNIYLNGIKSMKKNPSTPGALDSEGYNGIILNAARYPGIFASYTADGLPDLGPKNQGTPLSWENSTSFESRENNKYQSSFDLAWVPLKGLTFKLIGGYDFELEQTRKYRTDMILASNIGTGPSSLYDQIQKTQYKTIQATVDFNKTVNNLHHLNILAGYTWEDESRRYINGSRYNFPSDNVPYLSAGDVQGQLNEGSGYDWAMMSFFGRLTYNFDQRYLFETTLRYDGSSRFPSNTKFGFFPSVALGWRISEEKFWRENDQLTWFSNFKLKASHGVLGNNLIGNYPYQSVYVVGQNNYVFGGAYKLGAAVTTHVDPNLKWERTSTSDIGFETGFFKNKLTFNLSYFYRKTTDVLYKPAASYSAIFGLNISQINTGAVENKGVEFELGYQDRIGQFNYSVHTNLSIIQNKVLTLGMGNVAQSNGMIGNGNDLFVDYPMNLFYGYKTDGVFLTNEEVSQWYDQSKIAKNSVAGDLRYVDTNGDGKVTSDDKTYLGSSIPKYTFGASMSAGYKSFDFSLLLQGVAGVKGLLNNYAGFAFMQDGNIQRWQMEGTWSVNPSNRYPSYPRLEAISSTGTNNTLLSDFWIIDASFLKVRNIQLGYRIPQKWTNKLGIDNMRLYTSIENPVSFDHYKKGWDPENTNNGGQFYPLLSTYSLGLTLNF